MKCHRIVIGKKKTESCPFWEARGCQFPDLSESIKCKYGLTDIRVPKNCPLLKGVVLSFKVEKYEL